MNRSRLAATGLMATAALAAPLALAMPAQAHTSSGCTVTTEDPRHNGLFFSNGRKQVEYVIDVTCDPGRSINISQERWEYDPGNADDLIGTSFLVRDFTNAGGSTEIVLTRELPDTDDLWDQYEEMYHRVRFTVTSNGVTSPLTGWHVSGTTSIHV
jgi:hypothetical protein